MVGRAQLDANCPDTREEDTQTASARNGLPGMDQESPKK